MPDSLHVYLLDEAKNQHEGMTKEQIVTAIENMETTGSVGDVDAGFISKVLELNKHGKLRFWVGTMAEFNALETKDPDTLYLFTDDPTLDDIEDGLTSLETALDQYESSNDQEVASIASRLTNAENKLDTISGYSKTFSLNVLVAPTVVTNAVINIPGLYGSDWLLTFYFTQSLTGGGVTLNGSSSVLYSLIPTEKDEGFRMTSTFGTGTVFMVWWEDKTAGKLGIQQVSTSGVASVLCSTVKADKLVSED